jgi:hypothetical protein
MPLSRKLALEAQQIDAIMANQWNLRIATVGPGTRINLTPMWFGWHPLGGGDGVVYIYGRGQKVVNLRRDPTCTLIVDRNERFPELQGIMIQGEGRILEDAAAEEGDPHLASVREHMGVKYNGGHGEAVDDPPPFGASARGEHARWIRVTPENVVTWDNHKLADLRG